MGVYETLADTYKALFEDLRDPRTDGYLFAGTPFPMISIVLLYLLFIFYTGPKLMKNRQPYDIDKLVIIYNVCQIIFTGYLWFSSFRACYWSLKYNIICQPVEKGTSPEEMHIVTLVWLYHLVKIFDLLDTVFIILRKKSSQLSVLHIYHHSGMVVASWIGLKYVPGGQSMLTGSLNCFVHMIMYSYYLITIIDSKYRSSWWKKHITQLQFGQFAILFVHHILPWILDCGYPKWIGASFTPSIILLIGFFINFYRRAYCKTKTK